jgi:hypothetical protein
MPFQRVGGIDIEEGTFDRWDFSPSINQSAPFRYCCGYSSARLVAGGRIGEIVAKTGSTIFSLDQNRARACPPPPLWIFTRHGR